MSSKGLAYWARGASDAGTFFPTLVEFMQHPHFAEVARAAAERSLHRTEQRALAGSSSHDIYRFNYVLFILYLSLTGGVTRTRLVDFCTETRIASPGRAVALLNALRRSGHVALDDEQPDKRTRRYRATELLIDEFRSEQMSGLRSLARIEPEIEQAIARMDEPGVFRAFILRLAEGAAAFIKGRVETDISLFSDRNAGLATLFLLIATADASDPFPPKGPLQASLTAMSKRLHVSRGHIFRLLRDAETRGLLRRDPARGLVWLDERLRFQVALYLGAIFLGLIASSDAALNAPHANDSLAAS